MWKPCCAIGECGMFILAKASFRESSSRLIEMLEVAGLKSGYGRIPILMGIDLTVRRGEFIGVFGHNGMGKTTLLRTLAGHIRATGGRGSHDGQEITASAPHLRSRRGLGFVPQGREIFGGLTVR